MDPSAVDEPERTAPVSFDAVLRGLRRRWWILLLCTVVAGGAAFARASQQTKVYAAASSLLFKEDNLTQAVLGLYPSSGNAEPERTAATNIQLLALAPTVQRAAQILGISPDELRAKVSAAPSANSDIVLVSATDPDPKRAAYIANTYARVFITNQRNARSETILAAQRSVANQLKQFGKSYPESQVNDLRRQANQLQVIAKLQTGGVQLAAAAEPPEAAASPRPKRALILGALAGLLVGIAIALLLERFDNRVRTIDEFTERFDRPILGNLPPIPRRRDPLDDAVFQESVQLLRVNLAYVGVGTTSKVIAVSSAIPDEGKSTVSAALASALAQAGASVLLIEADLRRGSLTARLGVIQDYGLTDVLARGVDPARAVVTTSRWGAEGSIEARNGGRLSFLGSGAHAPNPADLIESAAMADLLTWAREQYDLVILDTPPVLAVPETLALLSRVDGSLVVGRIGASRRNRVGALARQLQTVGHRPLGLIVFTAQKHNSDYGFEYSAEYSGTASSDRPYWEAAKSAAPMAEPTSAS